MLFKTNLDYDKDITCFIKFTFQIVLQASEYKGKAVYYNCSIDFRCAF